MDNSLTHYQRLLGFFALATGNPAPLAHPDPLINSFARDMAALREAAVLLPITREAPGQESELVLTIRSENLKTHAGQISLPGGSREAQDPDIVATALRESREEIGVLEEQVQVIGRMGELPVPSGFRVTPIVGLIDTGQSFTACPIEVADIFRVPLSLVLEPQNYRHGEMQIEGKPRRILELFYEDYRIWGATAAILHHLATAISENRSGD